MSQFLGLLSKRQLQCIAAASTDDRRQCLNGLNLEPDGLVVATDGHILVALRDFETPAPVDFPTQSGRVDSAPLPAGGLQIPRAAVYWALRALPKSHLHVLRTAAVWIDSAGQTASLVTTDLGSWQEYVWKTEESEAYPNWRAVWAPHPRTKQAASTVLTFNAALLERCAELVATVADCKRRDIAAFALLVGDPTAATAFAYRGKGLDCRGLMPVRYDSEATDFAAPPVTLAPPTPLDPCEACGKSGRPLDWARVDGHDTAARVCAQCQTSGRATVQP